MRVSFEVLGVAQPKGSTRSYPFRRKDGSLGVSTTSDCAGTEAWAEDVALAARVAMAGRAPIDGPVTVVLRFALPAPKRYHARLRRGEYVAHRRKPDLDKLIRGALDPLSGIVMVDDNCVVSMAASKRYAGRPLEPEPIMRVTVDSIEAP